MEIYRTHWQEKSLHWAKGTKVIGARGFVFLSGFVGEDPKTGIFPEGYGAQTTLALEGIKESLEELNTSLKNICHIMWHVVGEFTNGVQDDPRNDERRKAEQEFWAKYCPEFAMGKNPPSSTFAVVSALAKPEVLLEITVIAAIPGA